MAVTGPPPQPPLQAPLDSFVWKEWFQATYRTLVRLDASFYSGILPIIYGGTGQYTWPANRYVTTGGGNELTSVISIPSSDITYPGSGHVAAGTVYSALNEIVAEKAALSGATFTGLVEGTSIDCSSSITGSSLIADTGSVTANTYVSSGTYVSVGSYIDTTTYGTIGGYLQVKGTGTPSAVASIEMHYTSDQAYIYSYNRGTTTWKPMTFSGSVFNFSINGATNGFYIQSNKAISYGNDTVPAWENSTNYVRFMQYGAATSFAVRTVSSDNSIYLANNCYYDGTNWKYVETNHAGVETLAKNGYSIRFAASGTAGNNITWVQPVTVTTTNNVVLGVPSLATNATDGFLYIPTCAGTPTGTPTTQTGYAPLVIDSTNNKLYAYIGGAWQVMN